MHDPTASPALESRLVSVPLALVLALISAGTALGVAYLARPATARGEPPANVATQSDIRDIREDIAQIRREIRAVVSARRE